MNLTKYLLGEKWEKDREERASAEGERAERDIERERGRHEGLVYGLGCGDVRRLVVVNENS